MKIYIHEYTCTHEKETPYGETYIYTCVYMHEWKRDPVWRCVNLYIYVWINVCTCIHMYMCTYVYVTMWKRDPVWQYGNICTFIYPHSKETPYGEFARRDMGCGTTISVPSMLFVCCHGDNVDWIYMNYVIHTHIYIHIHVSIHFFTYMCTYVRSKCTYT